MLGIGFALSITGIGGIGSLAAFIIGLKAKGIIQQSNGKLAGLKMAWWRIIIGALGMMVLPPLLLYMIFR